MWAYLKHLVSPAILPSAPPLPSLDSFYWSSFSYTGFRTIYLASSLIVYNFFLGGSYCSVLFSLAVFLTACMLFFSWSLFFWRHILSFPCGYYISRPLFSLVAPTLFLAAPIVCLYLAVLLYFASPSHCLLSYAVHYTMHCCASRSPLLVTSCLLPSFGFGCRCYLLTSPSLFFPALSSGALYTGTLAPSGLSVLLLLPFLFT